MKQQDLLVGPPGKPASSTNQPAQGAERRKGGRFAVSASADNLELHTRTHLSGRATDLGADGCYIDTVTPFPVGTMLMLNLTSENHNVRAKANVVYARIGMGMGLAFTEMTANQRENLSIWLRELSGELPEQQTVAEAAMPDLQDATIRAPTADAKGTGVLEALRELVSLLGNKRVLSEAEVELLREKMSE